MVTGIHSLLIEDDFGKRRDAEHGLISGSKARERWELHPDDPLSARGTCDWEEELEHDDIHLRTRAQCAVRADAPHFYLSAKMEAWGNGIFVYNRAEGDTIPRDHL